MDKLPSAAMQASLLEGRQDGNRGQRCPVKPASSFPIPNLGVRSWKSQCQRKEKGGWGGKHSIVNCETQGKLPYTVPHLLSVQSSMVQAGHTALKAEFCHPIVNQQEVSQLREKETKKSARRASTSTQSPAAEVSQDRAPRPAISSPLIPGF